MYTWNFTSNLILPTDPEWDILAKEVLGNTLHPERKKSFIRSRIALKNALKNQDLEASIHELKLNHFHSLEAFPDLTVSLTHTKEAGAALVAPRKDFLSLGIDIESEARVVKENIKERITHPSDLVLRNIELWCLKEASFKALMNSGKFLAPMEFASIKISEQKWSHPPSGLEGEWKLEKLNSFVVAMAFLKN